MPARPTATTSKQPAEDTALAAVARLSVKGRAPKTGYARAQFGQTWFDTDHNGCDTRNDVLRRDLYDRQMKNACTVLAGTLAPDPYTGGSIRFVYGVASEVDIDHLVSLSDAWQTGAAGWPAGKRLALANDPLNLLAVSASANRSKSDGDTATWLPPNKAYRCTYVAAQVAAKVKYGLWVTSAERDAMTRVLAGCPRMRPPGPGSAPILAAVPRAATTPVAKPVPVPVVPGGGAKASVPRRHLLLRGTPPGSLLGARRGLGLLPVAARRSAPRSTFRHAGGGRMPLWPSETRSCCRRWQSTMLRPGLLTTVSGYLARPNCP